MSGENTIDNNKCILLVEDDPAHQALIQRALEDWPETMQLVVLNSLGKARSYLENNVPDLVIADYRLPDGHGTELLANKEADALYPIVIMNDQGDEQIAVETIKAGARDYIIKSDASMADIPRIASHVLREWDLVIEQKRTEVALQESEERYRRLVERSPDAIAVIDEDYKLLFANPATASLLRFPNIDMLIGKSFLDLLDAEDQALAIDRVKEMLSSGSALSTREYRFKCFDDDEVYGAVTSTPLTYKGKPAIQTITRDVTQRKLAQAALQRAHDELENKIYERTRELEEANEKLLELDRLKSMFIASMSHELRTPLTSIIGFTGVILGGMSGELNPRQHDQLSRVNASAQHLLSLISDIIDVSKVEAGKVEVDIDDFSVNELIKESISQVRKLIDDKGLTLKLDAPEGITMHSDRRRLLQVVLNMVSNAAKYTEQGQINISAGQQQDRVWIKVSDTGVGISEEAMQRLFMPFERLDKLLSVKVLGTGLGLYLSKKLVVDVLQGDIGADSEFGKGSTFWVEIPQNLPVESHN